MRGSGLWARAERRGHWRGLLAVAVMIGLLAAASMTAVAGARRTASSYDRFRSATLAADALATVAIPEAARLQRLARLPEVEAAAMGTIYPAFVDIEGDFDLGVFASRDGNLVRTVNRGRMLAGRAADPTRRDEVAINELAAAQLDARVGSVVRLGTLTPDQVAQIEESFSGELEGPVLRLRVTGIVRNAGDLAGDSASALLYGTPAFDRAYRQSVGAFAAFAGFRLRDGAASFDSFAAKGRPIIGDARDASLAGAADTGEGIRDSLRFLSTGLVLIGLIALVVGLVAGGQALARQLALASRDQPALAALGLTRRDRAVGVLRVGLPMAAVAGVVALLAAVLLSPLTPIDLGRQAEPAPGVAFDAVVHLPGAAATAALVVVGAALVGWLVAGASGRGRAARTRLSVGARVARALGLGAGHTAGVRMALEPGAGRAAVPVRSALVAAVVAVAGVTASLTFAASLDRLADTPARYGKPWDLMPDYFDGSERTWARHPDVGELGLLRRGPVVTRDLGVTGYTLVAVKGSPQPTILDGRPPAGDGEVALGPDLLGRVGRDVGQTIEFARREGEPRTFRIVGTFLGPAQDQEPIAGGALFTPRAFDDVVQTEEVGTQGAVRWREGVDPARAKARFQRANPETVSAYAIPRAPGEVVNLARVESLPPVLAAFFAVVGAAALLHALLVSMRRRRQELAVLRALGFVRRQVAVAVATQSATIAVIGLVLGLPLGLALGRWAWILTADSIGVATDPLAPVVGLALVVPAGLAVANLLGIPLGARAARLAPAAVLRTE